MLGALPQAFSELFCICRASCSANTSFFFVAFNLFKLRLLNLRYAAQGKE
ncbi:hypothetical protein MGSAQ_002042 [marine sediment metagenome]|uniref:Uncharacterized protein n=1 Tax=marine sediment metagenome TaxID=412755 RepID=A0A1B6NU51_9ZZZZ